MKINHLAKIIYCRTFQLGVKVGNYFLGYRTPDIIRGPGCIRRLPEIIRAEGVDCVLIVCGPNIYRRGLGDSLIEALEEAGISYEVFCDIKANPTDENVEKGLEVLKSSGARGIIAFGGGSPMDCAKAIAAREANPKKTVSQLQGIMRAHRKTLPLWAVPTTAGTGSETTVAAVITEAKTSHKAPISDPALIPEVAVLDPELMLGLSPFITATTGMDALCHAVEAYTNRKYNTKLEKNLATSAVKLIYDNLYEAFLHGDNLEARQNMQVAAFNAGRAFTRGCVGYVHALGHPLSALYDLPHGLVMGVILPRVMRRFGESAYKELAELADVCVIYGKASDGRGLYKCGKFDISCKSSDDEAVECNLQERRGPGDSDKISGTDWEVNSFDEWAGSAGSEKDTSWSEREKALAFIDWIEEMNRKMGLPDSFEEIREEDISLMTRWADQEANPLYPVPEIWGEEEFSEIYHDLMGSPLN